MNAMEKVTQGRGIKKAAALSEMVREGLFEKLFAQRSEAGGGRVSCAGVCSEKTWAEKSRWGVRVLSGEGADGPRRGVEASCLHQSEQGREELR